MKRFLLFFAALLITGCATNPPTITEPVPVQYGKVFISSDITGAAIFIDNANSGKVTPDTFTLSTGSHVVKLEKDGYAPFVQNVNISVNAVATVNAVLQIAGAQKLVLIEDFANVSCTPCVVSNKILESLSNIHFGRKKVVVIKFPANFPSPNDPFYTANKPDCNARMSYYNIVLAPTSIVDGILKPIPSDSNDVKAKIQSRLDMAPKFGITVKDSIAGDTYFGIVKITVYDTSGLNISNLVMHTVVTETDIEFATPPGSNGETNFYDVMRKMLPANTGGVLGNIVPGQVLNFRYETTVAPSWNRNHLNVISYIQNKQSKEVYQAGSTF